MEKGHVTWTATVLLPLNTFHCGTSGYTWYNPVVRVFGEVTLLRKCVYERTGDSFVGAARWHFVSLPRQAAESCRPSGIAVIWWVLYVLFSWWNMVKPPVIAAIRQRDRNLRRGQGMAWWGEGARDDVPGIWWHWESWIFECRWSALPHLSRNFRQWLRGKIFFLS